MRKGGTKRQLMVRLKTAGRRRIAAMLRGGIGPVRVIKRAQVLRLLDQGVGPPQVADAVGVSPQTVRDVGWRYLGEGLDRALHEKPRPGHQPALSPGKAQRIVAMVCGPPPEGRARWSVRLIAEEAMKRHLVASVGRETIRVLLKQHDLKPWREKMWCVGPTGADYIARMEEVLATDEQPLQAEEPVVCLDERPVQLTADTRPPTPARPGVPARYDYECRRHGTANLFCVVEPNVGWHLVRATPNRTRAEFAKVIRALVDHYPGANTIHLVMDNLNIHARTSLTNTYGEELGGRLWDRLSVHYTPKHASWLNQAEIAIGLLVRECIGRRRIPNLPMLRRETAAWKRRANRQRRTIQWRFTRQKARELFGYRRRQGSPGRSKRTQPHLRKPLSKRSEE